MTYKEKKFLRDLCFHMIMGKPQAALQEVYIYTPHNSSLRISH